MEIESTLKNHTGQTLKVIYREKDPLVDLKGKDLQGVHAYCFVDDKIVVVYSRKKGYWTPPGGSIEPGESVEDTVIREVREETNMRVLQQEIIGYQDVYESERIVRQTRSYCKVEPIGDFVSDPDGDITEIKLIDPKDHKQYFDWGVIGDRLIERALEIQENFNRNRKK